MNHEVVIVGAGPNGLLLAGELRLAGVPVLLLERSPLPGGEPRANGLIGRVVQAMDLRGLYEPLAGRPGPPAPTPWFQFGGLPLDLSAVADNPLFALPVPQARIQQVLEERARDLGAEIRRGHEVTGFGQDADDMQVNVRTADGDLRLRTRWLVGADGGHSLIRKQAGIPFPGSNDDRFVSHMGHAVIPADRLDSDGALALPDGRRLMPFAHNRLPGGVFTFARLGDTGEAYLVAVMEWAGRGREAAPVTFADLQHAVDRVLDGALPLGRPTRPSPLLRRLEGVTIRQATRYRAGRVLLVGDAAHVHPAVGGPGLNLGLQDALNLGWKLAAEIRGWAPPGLLDTYQTERAPIGRRVALQSRAQLALLAPGDEVTALRDLLAELLRHDHTRRDVAALLAGADQPYDMGQHDPHPATGAWLPDLLPALTEGRAAVRDRLRAARPVVIELAPGAAEAAGGWRDRVDVVAARGGLDAKALLVRPDGHVAWAGGPADGLAEALHRWFGTPSHVHR
ncbi:FAD-dependent oxidoreductase [Micromonospora globispora]|uniref:FAD-dependent oxidoreductase n=2 Tax=Micromonospora globispora TaxID=1450148 RepID=A0A317K3R4_9ACTN|nr:FAD-dependent monooxygenase [Micromonospora globispora]PWU47749.1 FAD-dependent oxidoreductase [Micromonospora globispora]